MNPKLVKIGEVINECLTKDKVGLIELIGYLEMVKISCTAEGIERALDKYEEEEQ